MHYWKRSWIAVRANWNARKKSWRIFLKWKLNAKLVEYFTFYRSRIWLFNRWCLTLPALLFKHSSMDHSPIRQTFELGKFISTAGTSIINLVKLRSLVEKYRKMWKIQSCEISEFFILLYYARESVTTSRKCGNVEVCLIGEWSIRQW